MTSSTVTLNKRSVLACVVLCFLTIYMHVLNLLPEAFFPTLMGQLHISQLKFAETVAFLGYFSVVLTYLFAGLAFDVLNTRLLFLATVMLSMGSTFLLLHATSIESLTQSRVLLGFSQGLLMIGALKIATTIIPRRLFIYFIGVFFACGYLANVFELQIINAMISVGFHAAVLGMNILSVLLLMFLVSALGLKPNSAQKNRSINFSQISYVLRSRQTWLISFLMLPVFVARNGLSEFWDLFLPVIHHIQDRELTLITTFFYVGILLGMVVLAVFAGLKQRYNKVMSVTLLAAFISTMVMIYLPDVAIPFFVMSFMVGGFFLGAEVIGWGMAIQDIPESSAGLRFSLIAFISGYAFMLIYPYTLSSAMLGQSTMPAVWHSAMIIYPILLLVGSVIAWFYPAVNTVESASETTLLQDLKNASQGREQLGRVFWIVYVLGSVWVGVLALLILSYVSMRYLPSQYTTIAEYIHAIRTPLVWIASPYTLFSSLCVWRCVKNTAYLAMKFLSRAIVIIQLSGLSLMAVAGTYI